MPSREASLQNLEKARAKWWESVENSMAGYICRSGRDEQSFLRVTPCAAWT
jgi:hypothetical protein